MNRFFFVPCYNLLPSFRKIGSVVFPVLLMTNRQTNKPDWQHDLGDRGYYVVWVGGEEDKQKFKFKVGSAWLSRGASNHVTPCMTASVKQVSKITKDELYQGNYLSRTALVNVFHSRLLFDESSRSLLTPSFLSHCQASLPAPTLRLPAERALLLNASELEMSHSTLSRGWSVPQRRPLLGNLRTWLSPLVDIQRYYDCCSHQIEGKEQMRTLSKMWWIALQELPG